MSSPSVPLQALQPDDGRAGPRPGVRAGGELRAGRARWFRRRGRPRAGRGLPAEEAVSEAEGPKTTLGQPTPAVGDGPPERGLGVQRGGTQGELGRVDQSVSQDLLG